jgi:hypothetical protein
MTCDECEAIVIELARESAVDRELRDEARRHAARCSRCGEQLQEQLWLTEQIRAFAIADASGEAPPRVEIAVLAAWRAHHGAARAKTQPQTPSPTPTPPATGGEVLPFAPERPARHWSKGRSWMMPGFALAGLASAALALLFVWPAVSGGPVRNNAAGSHPAGAGASAASTTATATTAAQTAAERAQPETSAASTAAASTSAAGTGAEATAPEAARDVAADLSASAPPGGERGSSRAVGAHVETMLASANTGETEFQPLPYVEPLRSTEARHVVRVSMTSGDEVILGMLPRDRRTGEAFEADVLVGEDGIARASRIVR